MQNGVNENTASISDPGYMPGGSSGSGIERPVNEASFAEPFRRAKRRPARGELREPGGYLHTDHLGSVTMVTDGHGNVVSGGSMGGKANTVYKPYGEIDRMNSSGPDITKHKYTGQIEDKESGLYYYKARYYDPAIGRFLTPDSIIDGNQNFGMNRYMYVNGSPVNFRDPSGNLCAGNMYGILAFRYFGAVGAAALGTYKNYTGGGLNCSGGKLPYEHNALMFLTFAHIAGNNSSAEEQRLLMLGTELYYWHQRRNGDPTFLNMMSFRQRDAFYLYQFSQAKNDIERALIYESYMLQSAKGRLVEPSDDFDRGSFLHDQYGSDPADRKSRTANKKWMVNAWKTANGPLDYMAAATGTVLFTSLNLTNDYLDFRQKQLNWLGERTGIKMNGTFIKFTPPKCSGCSLKFYN